ncbi:MAG TPA: PAS domain S-box protein [Bacteroidales bacterium]|nr:PAS domain S-box protein [Bacteroidales bacterium]
MEIFMIVFFILVVLIAFFVVVYYKKKYEKNSERIFSENTNSVLLGNLFWNIFNTSGSPIFLLQDYTILNCNDMAIKVFRCTKKELIGKNIIEISPKLQPDGTVSEIKGKELFDRVYVDGAVNFEWWHKRMDGELFLAQVAGSSFETDNKHYVAAIMRDITKERQEQKELENYRLQLEKLVEEKTRELEESNNELRTINEELDASNEELYASNEELQSINEELDNSNTSLINEIDEHKKTQEEREKYRIQLEELLQQKTEYLAQLSERFNEVYSNSSDAITFMDVIDNGQIIKVFDMNSVALQLFSITKDQISESVYLNKILPASKFEEFKNKILPKLLAGNSVVYTETKDTGNGYWNSSIFPIKDKDGKVYRIAAFSRNVTAEYEKDKMAAILSSAIESWPYEFWVCDKEAVCIIQNKVSKEIWGNRIGKKIIDVNAPDAAKQKSVEDEIKALQGISSSSELEFETPDGPRHVLAITSPIVTKDEISGFLGLIVDITNQKKVEIALKESEKRLTQLLSSITDYKFTIEFSDNSSGKLVNNQGSLAVTGYTSEDFQNNPHLWFEMIHNDDKPLVKEWSEKINNGIDVEPFEYRIIHKNGEIVWISNTTVLKKDNNGKILGFDSLISNITERKNAELALKESEKRFYDAIDLQPLPVSIMIDGKTLLYNRNFTERFGYTLEDLPTVETCIEKYDIEPTDRIRISKTVQARILEKNNFEINSYKTDYKIFCKDGSEKWIQISDRRIGNMLITVFNDITERKESEERIKLSEEKYRLLAENIDDVIWKFNIKSFRYTYFSPSIFKLTGYTVEEVMGLKMEKIIMPESIIYLNTIFSDWMKNYKSENPASKHRSFEMQMRRKNGQPVWVEINATLIIGENGEINEMIGSTRNINARKVSDLALQNSEEKLRTVFNTSKDGIVLVDRKMNVIDINLSAIKKTGYKHEEICGRSIFGFLLKENVSETLQYVNSIWNKEIAKNLETDILIKNGGFFPVEVSASIMQLNNEEILLLLLRDISERKQHEKELLQSVINTEERERLNFSQELHDGLGPLLSAAKMYVEWLAEPDAKANSATIIPDIKKLLEESTRTVKDISFKLSPHILKNYGLYESLKAYTEKVEKTGKTRITLKSTNISRFDELAETVIYRVICECINNTLKHAKALNIFIDVQFDDNQLCIIYSDDGKGFDVETTLKECKGVGLLNMQSRLKSINGLFTIHSSPGKGTNVIIKVPIILK